MFSYFAFYTRLWIGAELSGETVILGEYAPSKHRGLISSIITLGSNNGTLLAAFVWLLVTSIDDTSFKEWVWRIPFMGNFYSTFCCLYAFKCKRNSRF